MSDLMKKIGMNSQTLRVVMSSPTDKITKDGIVDFHITDGSTSSHFMNLYQNANPTGYMTQYLSTYEMESIASETDPMSWGTDKDKMADINYTNVNPRSTPDVPPMAKIQARTSPLPYFPSQRYTPYPVQYSLRPTSSNFSETEENKKNFGKLFGK